VVWFASVWTHRFSIQEKNIFLFENCDKLQIIARFCPLVFGGSEEELVNLLKDNNDIIKVGVLNVLAKAGATLRKQLSATARCCF